MAAAIVRSLAVSALQLSRDRPPSHKGAMFRISQEGSTHDALRAVRTPPCYDPELAAVLRAACMVLAPGAAVPRGAVAYAVLAGPTLAAWYHLGAQVPWKRHVHLAVPVAGAPEGWTAERLARDATRHLRLAGMDIAEVTLRPGGEGTCTAEWLIRAGAGGVKKGAGKAAGKGPGPAAPAAFPAFPPRPDRPDIRLIAHFEVSPLPPARLPGLRKLARVAIDGANTAAFVPGGRAEVAAAVRAWAEAEARAAQGAAGKPASAFRKAASDATARLDMPRGWAWAPDEGAFVRPAFPASAMQWPPNMTTLKAAVALAVVLGVAYMLAMVALPEWGARIQLNRAIQQARMSAIRGLAT
jgi:hypothetical protein